MLPTGLAAVDCTKICVHVTYNRRSIDLLRIDQSGGAYISYDAWVFLQTGQSARDNPMREVKLRRPTVQCFKLAAPCNSKFLIERANMQDVSHSNKPYLRFYTFEIIYTEDIRFWDTSRQGLNPPSRIFDETLTPTPTFYPAYNISLIFFSTLDPVDSPSLLQ